MGAGGRNERAGSSRARIDHVDVRSIVPAYIRNCVIQGVSQRFRFPSERRSGLVRLVVLTMGFFFFFSYSANIFFFFFPTSSAQFPVTEFAGSVLYTGRLPIDGSGVFFFSLLTRQTKSAETRGEHRENAIPPSNSSFVISVKRQKIITRQTCNFHVPRIATIR